MTKRNGATRTSIQNYIFQGNAHVKPSLTHRAGPATNEATSGFEALPPYLLRLHMHNVPTLQAKVSPVEFPVYDLRKLHEQLYTDTKTNSFWETERLVEYFHVSGWDRKVFSSARERVCGGEMK